MHQSDSQALSLSILKPCNAIAANRVNHNQVSSLDIAVTSIAAAHKIDCEIISLDNLHRLI